MPSSRDRGALRLISPVSPLVSTLFKTLNYLNPSHTPQQFSAYSRKNAILERNFALFHKAVNYRDGVEKLLEIHSIFPKVHYPTIIPKMLTSSNVVALTTVASKGDMEKMAILHDWVIEFGMDFRKDLLALNQYLLRSWCCSIQRPCSNAHSNLQME